MQDRIQKRYVNTLICKCGCGQQIIMLWLPEKPGKKECMVACLPVGWDGNCWYTGQVEIHKPLSRPWEPPAEERLE